VETSSPVTAAVGERLKRPNELRDRNAISQTEYEAKRHRIWPRCESDVRVQKLSLGNSQKPEAMWRNNFTANVLHK
jgi:hypothetical protein